MADALDDMLQLGSHASVHACSSTSRAARFCRPDQPREYGITNS